MNDYQSHNELKYKPRWIAPLLRNAAKDHPIVVLTGARQVGKSTLLQQEPPFADWRYITMDDFDTLSQAKSDPSSLWAGTDRVVIDEVQKSTELLDAVKVAVDSNYGKYRFILSGSANILLMKKVSESLAGRAIYFALNPMTLGEMDNLPPTNLLEILFKAKLPLEGKVKPTSTAPFTQMWKGFMPPLMQLKTSAAVLRWWEGYMTTYLERDLRQLSQIDSLPDFRRLMIALALRCGQILNQTEVSRDTGISQPTVHRYINLLETTCLMERLPAFAINRTKRLIKSPKVMWIDPGLASFLAGHYDPKSLQSSREAGGIFESMVYLHLNALAQLLIPKPRIFYWRTTTGKEVDFVLEWGRKLLAIEVKLLNKPKFSDIKTLKLFLNEYPETSAGILIYGGDEVKIMDEKIAAIPWFLLGQ
ncbi:MAG: ATP-binding protein [Desulfobacteraceae bacterium]|uniref:ATP-binding protein n=1 Tax=Candidatus Desulfaltia bathyphila TaxID=2841697 RepID=A0A8J6N8F3_9BACT|nr:ATP-binding protein [Candidatus Desulfaltia bathyphila]